MIWSWVMVAVLVCVVPVLARRSGRGLREADVSRSTIYVVGAVSLWFLAGLGCLALWMDGRSLRAVGVPWLGTSLSFLLWMGAMATGGLLLLAAVMVMQRRGWLRGEGVALERMRPRTVGESMLVALLLSPSAGVCEEFLYRGFMLRTLEEPLGLASATLLATAAFGWAHLYQGWAGAGRAAVIGLLLASGPLATGSVLPSMAAHALVDAVGILIVWPWLMGPGSTGS